jgi:uncharacterized protein YkwD
MRFLQAALSVLAACAIPLAVLADEAPPLHALLVQARTHGCSGHAGTTAPLRWSPALVQAARRMAAGEAALQAAAHAGYRATRVFHASMNGYRSANDVVAAVAQHYCHALTDPNFIDAGAHRDGNKWVLVMAAPFRLPELADPSAVAARVLALTNDARAHPRRCGDQKFEAAAPLRANALLEQAAALHARDMAAHAYIEHVGRDGSTPAQRVTRMGYRWRNTGENVAAGQPSAEHVVEDWLSSPGHCANIMNPAYVDMGVAYAVNMNSTAAVYWAQEFGRSR